MIIGKTIIEEGKMVGSMKIITTIITKAIIATDHEKQVCRSIVHIVLQDRILSKSQGKPQPYTSESDMMIIAAERSFYIN